MLQNNMCYLKNICGKQVQRNINSFIKYAANNYGKTSNSFYSTFQKSSYKPYINNTFVNSNHHNSFLVISRYYSPKVSNNNEVPNSGKVNQNTVLSNAEKLKKAVKEYGSTVIVFHIGISLISLGLFYGLVSSGVDLTVILEKLGLGNEKISKLASNTGSFVIAYAVHKVFAPVRIGITLTATPFIVRHLRKIGWLKK